MSGSPVADALARVGEVHCPADADQEWHAMWFAEFPDEPCPHCLAAV